MKIDRGRWATFVLLTALGTVGLVRVIDVGSRKFDDTSRAVATRWYEAELTPPPTGRSGGIPCPRLAAGQIPLDLVPVQGRPNIRVEIRRPGVPKDIFNGCFGELIIPPELGGPDSSRFWVGDAVCSSVDSNCR